MREREQCENAEGRERERPTSVVATVIGNHGVGKGQVWENFQARRRNYIGSEWNISSGALHPTKTRKTRGLCNPSPPLPPVPTPSRRTDLASPAALVRIINGQFAASAADCIVSLFSGAPSVGWQVVFPLSRILSRLPPALRLSRRLRASSGFPSRSPVAIVPSRPSPRRPLLRVLAPLHFKSGSKFVKTARAARGFGHLESLRPQNTSRRISSRTFSPLRRRPSRREDGNSSARGRVEVFISGENRNNRSTIREC